MHQGRPWGLQQGWQQLEGGAAETALKMGRQRVIQGQPVAAAGLALLAAVRAWEWWGPLVERWPERQKVGRLHSGCWLLTPTRHSNAFNNMSLSTQVCSLSSRRLENVVSVRSTCSQLPGS